jgi:uncharacterized protein
VLSLVIWTLIVCLILLSFVGLVYPIIPSVVFVSFAFIFYGMGFSFEGFTFSFWLIQIILTLLLMIVDYVTNAIGVKRYGGSKAALWGSTFGLVIVPFFIPIIGLFIGPFIGAFVAEIVIHRRKMKDALKVGIGSLIGFLGGVFLKGIVQLAMILIFIQKI